MNQRERGRDALTLGVALLLLLAAAAGWWLWNERARARRDVVLAGVPEFPSPGQQVLRRRQPLARAPAPPPLLRADAGPAPQPQGRPVRDRLNAFALAPSPSVAVIQVNALFNTPLFARFKECAPDGFRQLEDAAGGLGLDLERDIDRVAMVPGGVAVSGFFEGKPLAEGLAKSRGQEATSHSYRDQTLWTSPKGACIAQLGTLLVMGPAQGCEALVDRALDSTDNPEASQELYGDLYARTDLAGLNDRIAGRLDQGERDLYGGLLQSLDGLTLRANVWDQVAVTVDGEPKEKGKSDELARMARGAIALARTQIGDDNVELQTLANLASVKSEGGKLKLDLALPADDLFDRLHLPCPGRADAGPRQ